MAAHGAPYVAQVAPNKWKDMSKKIKTAIETEASYLYQRNECMHHRMEISFQSDH